MRVIALVLPLVLVLLAPSRGWSSVILHASEIVSVRILSAELEPWQAKDNLERRRKVNLNLSVERVLKGTLKPGANVKVVVTQAQPLGRIFAVSGAWSYKPVERDLHYVIFATNASLADETLLRVTDDKAAPGDVELALSFENHGWSLADLGKRAGRQAGSLGPLFADYLKTRLPTAVIRKGDEWNLILQFIESDQLNPAFRSLASEAAIEALLMNSPAPDDLSIRTIVGAFRCLAFPDANGLHNRLLQSELPNLLGWEGTEPKRTASQVFRALPTERIASEKVLLGLPASPTRDRLLQWIRQ